MLDILLLKVNHEGATEAQKLKPYIEKCDLFCQENALQTQQTSEKYETEFEKAFFHSGWTQGQFMMALENAMTGIDDEHKSYYRVKSKYLFQNKVRIWSLERFSEATAEILSAKKSLHDRTSIRARNSLLSGNIDAFFELSYEELRLRKELLDRRDKEMGRTITNLEKEALSRYPVLKEKEVVRVIGFVGYNHFPENYTNVAVRTLDIRKQPDDNNIHSLLSNAYYDKKPDEEIRYLMLKSAAILIAKESDPNFPIKTIEAMSYDELLAPFIEPIK